MVHTFTALIHSFKLQDNIFDSLHTEIQSIRVYTSLHYGWAGTDFWSIGRDRQDTAAEENEEFSITSNTTWMTT